MYKKVVSKFSLVVLSSLMILHSCNNFSNLANNPEKIIKNPISTVNPMKIVLKDNKFKTKSNELISVKAYKNILVGGVLFESINVFRTTSSEDTFVITLVTSSNQEFKPYLFEFKGTPCNSGVYQEINDDSSEVDVYYVANGRYSLIINHEPIADEIIMDNPQTIDLSMSEDEDYVTFNVNAQGNDYWKITLTGPETNLESTCNIGLFNQGHRIKKKSYSTTDMLYVTKKGTYTFTMSSQFRDLSVSKTFEILEDAKNECDCGNQNNVNLFGVKTISMCPPCPDPCDKDTPPLLPEDINNLLQKLGQYLLPNALSPLIGKTTNFTNNVNSANNLAGQYGFSTQATKEEKARVKYDAFVEQINQSKQELLTESSNLKTVASNILNEVKNTSNINKQLLSKESDFNSYKQKVEELVDEFNYFVTDENTFSLAEASAVYGQEVGLLANIIEDYANRVLPVKVSNEEELEQYQDDETGFEKIQTTKGLIRYLKARIEGQKTRLHNITSNFVRNWNEYKSLDSEINLIQEDLNYIISITDELLNLDSNTEDLGFSTQNFLTRGDEQGLPARDRMEIDRLRSWNSYAKQNLTSTRVQYRDKYQELINLKQIRDSGGKKSPNGDPINQAIKNVGKELNQLKTQIRSTNKTAKTSQKNLNTKINELNSCTKNNSCNFNNLPFKKAEIDPKLLSSLEKLIGKSNAIKFIRALEKGMAPRFFGTSGIKKLDPPFKGFDYELKINKSGARIFGNIDSNGTLNFSKFDPKGAH